ncbi:MAG: glutaredoxin 3 [Gammaproteobacteria bacterium]|nr:glutaredoxin 3 [Gammaproteobacteria bacterium]
MSQVVIYSTLVCPYCIRAKKLLERKGVKFTEIRIDTDSAQRELMVQRSGRRTVPQIFIDEIHVGGCDDLYELESAGTLDNKLGLK